MTVVHLDRPTKYRAKRTEGYASKREYCRSLELSELERAGKITNLREQPRYLLLPADGKERAIYYVADFEYFDVEKQVTVTNDVKGFRTPLYRLKKRLMKYLLGIDILETT